MDDVKEPPQGVWTEEQKARARQIARAWAGTPHRHRIAVRGVGIDCIHLFREIYVGSGLLPPFELPSYDVRLGLRVRHNVMEDALCAVAHFEAVNPYEPAFGDVMIFRVGRTSNHTGVVQFCMGDGSVRGLRPGSTSTRNPASSDWWVLQALGGKSDGVTADFSSISN